MSEKDKPVKDLSRPDLFLEFKRNQDGSYSVSIPLSKSGNENEIPLLRVTEKNLRPLQAALNNALLQEGVPTKVGKINVDISGEIGGKASLGGDIKGESGELERIAAGKVSGGINAGGEISGKLGGNLKLEITPGSKGLSPEIQEKLRQVLDTNADRIYNKWIDDTITRGGARIPLGDGSTLSIGADAAQKYKQIHNPEPTFNPGKIFDGMNKVIDTFKKSSDAGSGPTQVAANGLESPGHPYHRMYSDAAAKLGEMGSQTGSQHAPETLAAALTLSAANAKFDPSKPIEIMPGKLENTLFAVQGDPSSPASKSAMIDTANPKSPTAEQVAQLQSQNTAQEQQIGAVGHTGPTRA